MIYCNVSFTEKISWGVGGDLEVLGSQRDIGELAKGILGQGRVLSRAVAEVEEWVWCWL